MVPSTRALRVGTHEHTSHEMPALSLSTIDVVKALSQVQYGDICCTLEGGKTKPQQPTLIQNYSPLRPFPKQELEEDGGREDEGEGVSSCYLRGK